MPKKPSRGRPPKPRPTKSRLLKLIRQGMTRNEIANRYNVSLNTVRKWRLTYGITERAKDLTQISEDDIAEIRRLHDEGVSLEKIGDQFGRTRQGIHWMLRRYRNS